VAQEGEVEQQPVAPLPGDLKPRIPRGSGTAVQVASQAQVSASVRTLSRSNARGDDWFTWVLALASLAVPAVVLVCVDSIPKDAVAWHDVSVSVDRGDFLIPAMALCVETIRRLWRDVDARRMKAIRVFATFVCAATGLVCVIATTTAASLPVTSQTGSSIAVITCSCLVVGVAFGTVAVGASGDGAA
jgi:hypothetical protein